MSPQRIAIVLREMGCGGAERMVVTLGSLLRERGNEVTIVTTSRPGSEFGLLEAHGLNGIHIEGRFTSSAIIHAFRVGNYLRRTGFDVVIPTNSERFVQSALNLIENRVVVIPWIHSDYNDAYNKAKVNNRLWNIAVACGPGVAAKASKRMSPVVSIPNGRTFEFDHLADSRVQHSHPFKLIYVGRLTQLNKNVLLLPQILRECIAKQLDVQLEVVGEGDAMTHLIHLRKSLGLESRMTLLGLLDEERVFQRLASSHALLLPSSHEGLPIVPIEAQSMKCVPIATRLPGVTDVVIEVGLTGFLVNFNDTAEFAQRIGYLVANPSKWKQMGELGRKKVALEFDTKRMGDTFAGLIERASKGEYPTKKRRRPLWPVNVSNFSWREMLPRFFRLTYWR